MHTKITTTKNHCKRDNIWKTISKTPLKLEETSKGFKLINLSDGVEEYSKEGKLLSITNAGQVTSLSYNPRGELALPRSTAPAVECSLE